jgi:hypothetical protein
MVLGSIQIDLTKLILILRFTFLYFFFKELLISSFKNKKHKIIWFFLVLLFGYFGYLVYISLKRDTLLKKSFRPNFTIRK